MPYTTHQVMSLIAVERPGLGTMAADEYCRLYVHPAYLENATNKPTWGTTVKDDAGADQLWAAPSASAVYWFFRGALDLLHNYQLAEHIN
jgi:hypothetical protein